MGRRNNDGSGISPLTLFGEELHYYRNAAGYTQDQLGGLVGYSGSLVAAIETCFRSPSADFAQRCDEALNTGGALTRLLGRLKKYLNSLAFPSWFREWPPIEERAVLLRAWENMVIPGLLQTEDYARAMLRGAEPETADDVIGEMVAARMARQAILDKEDPPLLRAIMDEGALRRMAGSPKVMRVQLLHLNEMSQRPNVSILVVPASAGTHPGLPGAFTIATVPGDGGDANVVYLDTAAAGQITDHPDVVDPCVTKFDTLLAEALSPGASAELIAKVAEEWTT